MGTFSNTSNIKAQTTDPGAIGAGAIWSDTDASKSYRRNDANTSWTLIATGGLSYFGDGSDGDVTISANTDLGSANTKRYNSLIVNAGVNLHGNAGTFISILGNLTLNGNIHVNSKGMTGGTSNNNCGAGGTGAGSILVAVGGNITGTGKIQANGGAGGNSTGNSTGDGTGQTGNNATIDGATITGTGGGGETDGFGGGAGGGGCGASGASGTDGSAAGGGGLAPYDIFPVVKAAGGGGGSGNTGTPSTGGGGGGGGGLVILILLGTSTAITLEAKGGAGGTGGQVARTGGTGGGGKIKIYARTNPSSIVTDVTGGNAGITANYVI